MERIEYRDVIDKTGWQPGPWDDEPDKVQWPDEATGLPCLIVRGPVGGLCGYVGVLPGHPLHGVDHSDCPKACGKEWCDHRPEHFLEAHGGITFAGKCSEISREKWEKWRATLLAPKHQEEARNYPYGDAAERLREWKEGLENYEAWSARCHARHICHIPAPGDPDDVWWFGFDCAHAGDICPKMSSYGIRSMSGDHGEVYRDIAYVAAECAALAQQLAARCR